MIANPPHTAVDDVVRNKNEPSLIKPLKNCPRQQTSDLVHAELSRFFNDLFPSLIISGEEIHYQLELLDYHDEPVAPKSLTSLHEVPEEEVYHLLQGWIKLQQALANDEVHPQAKATLENFRVPDPRHGIECYRVYEDEGRKKMFIEWGLEKADCPAIKLDHALALILGVPVSRLQTILFTFMMTVLPKETIHHSLIQAVTDEDTEEAYEQKHGFFHDPIIRYSSIAAAAVVLVAALLTFQWNQSQPHPEQTPVYKLKELTREQVNQPIPSTVTHAETTMISE